jgi:hypothetical protein
LPVEKLREPRHTSISGGAIPYQPAEARHDPGSTILET